MARDKSSEDLSSYEEILRALGGNEDAAKAAWSAIVEKNNPDIIKNACEDTEKTIPEWMKEYGDKIIVEIEDEDKHYKDAIENAPLKSAVTWIWTNMVSRAGQVNHQKVRKTKLLDFTKDKPRTIKEIENEFPEYDIDRTKAELKNSKKYSDLIIKRDKNSDGDNTYQLVSK